MKNYITTQQPILDKNKKLNKINDEEIYLGLEQEFNQLSMERGNKDMVKKASSTCRNAKQTEFFLEKTQDLYNHNLDKIRKKNKLLEFIVVKLIR
jgi:hypothetical protein